MNKVTSKSSTMGLTAGIVTGVMLGTAVGMAVKGLTSPKSPMKKTMSVALNTVGEMFSNLAKFTS